MASPSQNLTPRLYHGAAPPLAVATALAVWALATATFFALGLSLGGGLVVNSVAMALALGLVPVAALRLHGGGGRAELGLGPPPWRAIAGAALAGAGTWYVALRIARPIIEAMRREDHAEQLSRAVLGDGAALPLVLVASALVPGVCEELLHRGVLLPALAARAGRVVGVVVAAVLFALMHLEPARIAATLVIGLCAGTLAVASRSLWPAMTVHVVNNALAILIATGQLPLGARAISRHPDATLGVAVLAIIIGVVGGTWGTLARSRQS